VVTQAIPDLDATVLVVCGGNGDKELFRELQFRQVTISNLNPQASCEDFKPYSFRFEDAEALTFEDNSFDYVVVHAGLHHCQSPHRALLEMYRVARRATIIIEARDSIVMRLATKFGLTSEYEILPVALGSVGMRNTHYPNYVYRWTEREVRKTVASYAPELRHEIKFFYGMSLPVRHPNAPRSVKHALISASQPFAMLLKWLMPSQCNLFAFAIRKPSAPVDLQPWMKWDGATPSLKDELKVGQGAANVGSNTQL
jgi:SAM-dependent methyltransferase